LIDTMLAALEAELVAGKSAERIRQGFEVAILGKPNVGKSTLLNALAGRDAAITSEHAGTTRDVIEVRMDLGGLPVTLLDTAGIREAADPVERIGIERALKRAEAADLRVFLVDSLIEDLALPFRSGDLRVIAKADHGQGDDRLGVSGKTGHGIDLLIAAIVRELAHRVPQDGVVTRQRHLTAMQTAIEALEAAKIEVRGGLGLAEIAAADVRRAIVAMDVLVGKLGVEDFLGEIFASFCIGK
jgi:tRNA modification GTPase